MEKEAVISFFINLALQSSMNYAALEEKTANIANEFLDEEEEAQEKLSEEEAREVRELSDQMSDAIFKTAFNSFHSNSDTNITPSRNLRRVISAICDSECRDRGDLRNRFLVNNGTIIGIDTTMHTLCTHLPSPLESHDLILDLVLRRRVAQLNNEARQGHSPS